MKWLYSRKISTMVLSFITIAFAAICIVSFANFVKPYKTEISSLEKLTGTKGEFSEGYNHGDVYSIDGVKIASDFTGIIKEDENEESYDTTIFGAEFGYSSIIGADGRGGLLNSCHQTLQSSAKKANRKYSTGNSITTTLSNSAQLKAVEMLQENFSDKLCDSASVSVVLRDGAVLVAAGMNEYQPTDFFENTPPDDLYIDHTAMNMPVGSVAKVITARMLLLKDKLLSAENSLYNDEYVDLSWYQSGDVTIHNWDYELPSNYENIRSDGVMERISSLNDALRNSSNTYFWRHALALGLEESYSYENELFAISSPIVTEINTLDKIEKNRLDYYFWGQDCATSNIRLCQLSNNVLCGEAYAPFYVASVNLPDGEEIYHAQPEPRKDLSFKVKDDDILRDALSECFDYYSMGIDKDILAKHQDMIDNKQFLAKSGTADKDESKGTTNNTRILTILDENHKVICSSCILIENAVPGAVNDNILFSILIETLEAAGII